MNEDRLFKKIDKSNLYLARIVSLLEKDLDSQKQDNKKNKERLKEALSWAYARYKEDSNDFSTYLYATTILPYRFGVELTPHELEEYIKKKQNG